MKQLILAFISAVLLAGLFFAFTNPQDLPIGFLMLPVILTFAVFSLLSMIAMRAFSVLSNQTRHRKGLSILIGVVAAFILVFQSTGGLVAGDIILMSLIFIVSYIYIAKY